MRQRLFVLTGGGTLGSVTPLLAVVESARQNARPYSFQWIGTATGPERRLIKSYDIPFTTIQSDKLRRYADFQTLLMPFRIAIGIGQAWRLLKKIKPDAVLSVGAYVSVPVAIAAWISSVPLVLHEMDKRRGLAIAVMGPLATVRTSVWPRMEVTAIGNMVRPSLYAASEMKARQSLGIANDVPIILVTGGGTGATRLNVLIETALPELTRQAVVVHLTGPGKALSEPRSARYIPIDSAESEMVDYLAAATIVISRAGMGILSELAALSKCAILIPLPNSHQQENASYIKKYGAAFVLDEATATATILSLMVMELLNDDERRRISGAALHGLIPDGTQKFMSLLETMAIT